MENKARAKISFRVGTPIWYVEDRFEGLLTLLEKYRDTIDEVACFTGWTHPPRPLSVIEDWAEVIKNRMPRMKEIIPSVGINHLATMGHLNENLPNSLNEPFQRLMGIDGDTIAGCFCPSDPGFQEYVGKVYVALAKSKPDFIWIDDDIRMEGHGSPFLTCFCDRCLDIFSRESGAQWTRDRMKEALNGGTLDDRITVRKSWVVHVRDTMDRLLALCRDSVDSVDPSMEIGLMSGETSYSGCGYQTWCPTLSGSAKLRTKCRP
jgi:hypothetical protein